MCKRTLIFLGLTVNLAIAGAACSSARGNENEAAGGASGSGEVTIAGCLSGSGGNFALTAAPDAAVATAARAMSDERTTHSYVLIGGNNLQEHAGKRVEVVGTLEGGTRELDHDAKAKTEAQPSGGETPSVATKEEVEIEVRKLVVREVRPVSGTCTLTP